MKHTKFFLTLLFMTGLGVITSSAQQGVVSAGGEATGVGGSVQRSTGLTDFRYFFSQDGSVQYGIQQSYQLYNLTTNSYGLITYIIGDGSVVEGVFADIDWSDGPYFLKTETDPTGGTNYAISGVTQFLSVPYALHSKTAEAKKDGSSKGEFLFWNGYEWLAVVPGQYGQTLSFCDGVPTWGPCPPSVPVVTTSAITFIADITATGGGVVVEQGGLLLQHVVLYGALTLTQQLMKTKVMEFQVQVWGLSQSI